MITKAKIFRNKLFMAGRLEKLITWLNPRKIIWLNPEPRRPTVHLQVPGQRPKGPVVQVPEPKG